MTNEGIEPLEPETWLAQFNKLAGRPHDGEALASSLRLAFHLVQLTPRPLRHLIRCTLSESSFDALLESGGFAEAALALLGEQTGYTVSRLPGGTAVTAEVRLAGDASGCEAAGATLASAVFAAWLGRLASLDEPEPADASRSVRHKDQSGLRPRSTEH